MLETEGYGEEDPQGATGQLRNSTAGHKPQAPPWHRHRDPGCGPGQAWAVAMPDTPQL